MLNANKRNTNTTCNTNKVSEIASKELCYIVFADLKIIHKLNANYNSS